MLTSWQEQSVSCTDRCHELADMALGPQKLLLNLSCIHKLTCEEQAPARGGRGLHRLQPVQALLARLCSPARQHTLCCLVSWVGLRRVRVLIIPLLEVLHR